MHSTRCVALLLLFGLVGCSRLTGPQAGSEQAARAHLTAEFTKWIAGQKSEAETRKARLETRFPPLAYEVRSVVPDQPDFMAFDDKQDLPDDWRSWPAFRFNVYIEWKSEAGRPLKDVTTYTLTWNPHEKKWYISERF